MLHPVCRRFATPVVRRHDQRGLAGIGRIALQRPPEILQHAVGQVQVIEQAIVAIGVCPVIRLAQRQPHNARFMFFEIGFREAITQDVVAALLPQTHHLSAQLCNLIHVRRRQIRRHAIVGTCHHERIVAARRRIPESVPRTELCDLPVIESHCITDVFEKRRVRITHERIVDNFRLVSTGKDFRIARR
jgi:hypothetical protein